MIAVALMSGRLGARVDTKSLGGYDEWSYVLHLLATVTIGQDKVKS